jgi:hypothetical protein
MDREMSIELETHPMSPQEYIFCPKDPIYTAHNVHEGASHPYGMLRLLLELASMLALTQINLRPLFKSFRKQCSPLLGHGLTLLAKQ